MAGPRETPRLEGEEIEMSVLQGGFNRQDPEVPPPLPPKQSRQDPSCHPKQTWTDPSCRPKQPQQGLPAGPEDPTHRARRKGGRKARKEPSRPPDQTLDLPYRSRTRYRLVTRTRPRDYRLVPPNRKQRDGKTAGVYRHRLREEDLVKLPLNPMYGADLDLPSEPDDQQTTPKEVFGAAQAEMTASGGPADDSPPADGPGQPLNRDARSARPVHSTQRPGRKTGGAQPAAAAAHMYEDGETFMGLGQPLNRDALGAPTLPKSPRPGGTTDGAQPAAAAAHTYENEDTFRQGLGPALNRDDGPPPVPSTPRPGGPPGGAQQLPSWPQMLLNPQAIINQLQPNAMYDSNVNHPQGVGPAPESRTVWERLRHHQSPRLLMCAAISSVTMVTLLIVVSVLLTHRYSRPGYNDSPATTTSGRNTADSTAWRSSTALMKTDQGASADVIKVSPVHGRGPSHCITSTAGPAPINKPVSTATEDHGSRAPVITFGDKSGAGKLRGARGVVVSPDNKIWVADQTKTRLQVYSMAGAFLYPFPQGAPGLGYPAKEPYDVSIDRDGHLWVLMSGYPASPDSLVQLDREGQLKAKFDLPGTTPWEVHSGMAAGLRNNHVIVTWSDGAFSGGVQAFQPDGKVVWDGQRRMKTPTNVAVNGEGNIFVSDFNTHYIYRFDENGRYVMRFGGAGRSGGDLNHPRGICADSSGHILVADRDNQRVVVYTDRGEYVRHIAVRAKLPTGVAVGPGGQLVVINHDTITVFPRY
ncbi:PREDICTED: uncharacterized protein LOC109480421 [Branchiostoma belcheri]|uniref:Uncharacterized protein LOC109480421 n=1 Tax=Branchiostoma belcheri TaxID=7741 RepID=A0A6P4ZVZ9_BRABE|nr:PREDICTED: uncharacterized protein LOC109480421 [Branchiostoma belcheri]